MAARQLPLPGEIVKKSNAICRAYWMPKSVWEARIVAILASKIRADDEDLKDYRISVTEILGENPDGRTREILLTACKSLTSEVLELPVKGKGFAVSAILSEAEYKPKEGLLYLSFSKMMKPHYLNLQKNFAELNLFEYLILPSGYSQRIYEILKSYDDLPEITINISDLFLMLDAPESLRKNFKDFRRVVLEKAAKDIKKHTSLEFEWEPLASGNRLVKRGMTTVAIRFTFSKKRVDEAAAKKREEYNSKKRKKNNDLYHAMMDCYHRCGGDCKEDLDKEMCKLCRSVNPHQTRLA